MCNCNDGTHPPPYVDQQTKEWTCVDETVGSANHAMVKRKRKRVLLDRKKKRKMKKLGSGNGGRRELLGRPVGGGSSG